MRDQKNVKNIMKPMVEYVVPGAKNTHVSSVVWSPLNSDCFLVVTGNTLSIFSVDTPQKPDLVLHVPVTFGRVTGCVFSKSEVIASSQGGGIIFYDTSSASTIGMESNYTMENCEILAMMVGLNNSFTKR